MATPDTQLIRSRGWGSIIGMVIFALVWSGFTGFATAMAIPDIPAKLGSGEYAILLIFLFPLVGLGLLGWCAVAVLHQLRFGNTVLWLDPYPGAIGGQLGGEIRIPEALPPTAKVEVIAQCLRSERHRKSKGGYETRTRSEWETSMTGRLERSAQGSTVRFLFDVPADLPPPSPKGDRWHHWALRVMADIPGVDLDLSFALPMVNSTQHSAVRLPGLERERAKARSEQLVQLLNPDQQGDTLYFDLPYGRGRGTALVLALAGIIFGGAGVAMMIAGGGAIPLLMGLVFVPAGLGMLAGALYIPFNRLQVAIEPDAVHVRRHWMGREVSRRRLPLEAVRALKIEETGSMSDGTRTTHYFRVVLETGEGKRWPVAESIAGRDVAEEAQRFLLTQTSLRRLAGAFGDEKIQ